MDKESIVYDTANISDIPELIRLRILYMIDDFGSITGSQRIHGRKISRKRNMYETYEQYDRIC